MELYFERPLLVRTFYYPCRTDYLAIHVHDQPGDLPDGIGENVERSNVIYLYRNPVDTIYSQLRYHGERTDDESLLRYWADLYGRHLDKWLHSEHFTTRKTVLTYEAMKTDLASEFKKVTDHFHQALSTVKLHSAAERASKDELKRLVAPERPQVVQTESSYEFSREKFRQEMSQTIWRAVLAGRPYLQHYFTGYEGGRS